MSNLKIDEIQLKGTATVGRNPMQQIVDDSEVGIELHTDGLVEIGSDTVVKYSITDIPSEESEGGIEKTSSNLEPAMLKQSNKKGYNPNTVGFIDSDDDGGIIANRTVIIKDNDSGSIFNPPGSNSDDDLSKNKYEVSGFSIQYQTKGSKGIAEESVHDYYDSLDEAMNKFNGGAYIKPDGNIGMISSGAPIVCFNDQQIRTYVNEVWKRN